jgi:steroid delta-isomerase-like uncharacterized protein
MSIEQSKDVVRRWFAAFNERRWEDEAACRTPDFIAHVPGVPAPLDDEQWRTFIGTFAVGFPDYQLVIQEIFAEGDRVAVRSTFEMTHLGAFQGVPPTGRRVRMEAIEVNRVAGGRVAEHWVVLDTLGLLQQLGALPAPG